MSYRSYKSHSATTATSLAFRPAPTQNHCMPASPMQTADVVPAAADNSFPDLPVLGGARPRRLDVAVWTLAIGLAIINSMRACCFAYGDSGVLELVYLFAAPYWALWRFGRFSSPLADIHFRRELALTGISAEWFLNHQLRKDAVAAIGPIVLLGSTFAFGPHAQILAPCAISSILVTLAGMCWVFRGKCHGAGQASAGGRSAITMVAASIGVLFLTEFPRAYGMIPSNPGSTSHQYVRMLGILMLFPAAAQIRFLRPTKRSANDAAPATYFLIQLTVWALIAGASFAGAWGFFGCTYKSNPLVPDKPLADGYWSDMTWGSGSLTALCVAALSIMLLRRFVRSGKIGTAWPVCIAGGLAIAAGICAFPTRSGMSGNTDPASEIARALGLTLPAAGLALYMASRPAAKGVGATLSLIGILAVSVALGTFLGLTLLVNGSPPTSTGVLIAGTAITWMCAEWRRKPAPAVLPLIAAVLLVNTQEPHMCLLMAASICFIIVLRYQIMRNYLNEL